MPSQGGQVLLALPVEAEDDEACPEEAEWACRWPTGVRDESPVGAEWACRWATRLVPSAERPLASRRRLGRPVPQRAKLKRLLVARRRRSGRQTGPQTHCGGPEEHWWRRL